MAGVSIRQASRDDLAAIVRCMAAAFSPYEASHTPGAWQDTVLTIDGAEQRSREMTFLVAELPSAGVVGTIAYSAADGGEGHLRGMAVDPTHQGAGIAERLLRQAEDDLRRAGCVRVTLDTTRPLRRAIRFYERSGYRATGMVCGFGMALVEYEKPLS